MNKIFFLLLFLISISVFSQIKVATVDARGVVSVNTDFEQVKDHFNKILRMENKNVVLQRIDIQSNRIDAREDNHYYAYGSNRDNTVKIAHALKFVNGDLFFDITYSSGTTICSGSGTCSPILSENGYFVCSGGGDADCTKSSTVTSP